MKKVFIFLANGFEDIEALAPADILRRGGVDVTLVSISNTLDVASAHAVTVKADALLADIDFAQADMLVLPGGMPGAKHLDECKPLTDALVAHNSRGGLIGAICAAPMVLGHLGLLDARQATCYPGFEPELRGAQTLRQPVVESQNITTAYGPGAAMAFGYALLARFASAAEVEALKRGMMYIV